MSKQLTRKQLKKPDEFLSFAAQTWHMVTSRWQENWGKFAGIAVGIALAIGGAATWHHFAQKRSETETEKISQALAIYRRPLLSVENQDQRPDLDPDSDTPQFRNLSDKLKAAETALENTSNRLALILRASFRYDQGKYDLAIADYDAYLKGSDDNDNLRGTAVEGLAYSYEAKKDWAKALEYFRKVPSYKEDQFQSLYHEARLLAAQGKKQEAIEKFKQIAEKAKLSPSLVSAANDRIALLK